MPRAKRDYHLTEEMVELLGEFEENLILFEKSERTIKNYLDQMKRFIADNDVKTIEDFTVRMNKLWWLRYVKETKEEGKIAISTLNNNMKIYSSFYNFLKMNAYIEGDIPCKVCRIKQTKMYKGDDIFTEEEVRAMLRATDDKEFKNSGDDNIDLRNKTLVFLLCNTALRIDEVHKVRIEDINLETNTLYVRGKGGKNNVTRKTNFNNKVKDLIIQLILVKPNRVFLFENYRGEPLSTQGIRKTWYKCQDVAGVKRRTPHNIRHFTGTKLVEKGVPIEKVREILGHSSGSQTTEKFYVQPNEDVSDTLEILDIF